MRLHVLRRAQAGSVTEREIVNPPISTRSSLIPENAFDSSGDRRFFLRELLPHAPIMAGTRPDRNGPSGATIPR